MNPPTISSTSSDQEIAAAVAEHVAGMEIARDSYSGEPFEKLSNPFLSRRPIPAYATDANAVLPLLEKFEDVEIHRVSSGGWQVSIMNVERTEDATITGITAEAWEDTLVRAACLAILRAKGVTVTR